jgi:formylglycine-generating enzyme required for sulfatase activity
LAVLAPGFALAVACASLSGLTSGQDGGSDTGVKHSDGGLEGGSKRDVGTRSDAAARDVGAHDAPGSDTGNDAGRDAGDLDAGPLPPPSCAEEGAGRSNCGVDGGESCCTSLEVAAGTFQRAYSVNDGGLPPSAAASVSAFRLDKYPVTVGRFRAFIHATNPDSGIGWAPVAGSGKHSYLDAGALNACPANTGPDGGHEQGWLASYPFDPTAAAVMTGPVPTYTAEPGADENLPMNEVSWYLAYAFCIWDGGFLPTLTELEYAAAGGDQQRAYPWGSTPPATAPNQYAIYGCHYPDASALIPDADTCESLTRIAPVGTAKLGLGRWNQLDLTGNVTAWALDKYEGAYVDSEWQNCVYLGGDAGLQYFLGTAWAFQIPVPAARGIGGRPPGEPDPDIGFRCARAP